MSSYAIQARENMLSNAPRKYIPKQEVKRSGETNDSLDWDINPLALPKGKVQGCEVCKDRCRYHCPYCKAAFYCTKAHREKDYRTIHKDICTRLDFLNHPKNPRCNDERIRVIKQNIIIKTEIIAIAKGLAETSLFELRAEDALEQLKAAFKYMVDLEGSNTVKLVEIYALYIEAFIKAGDMPKAEEQLRKAEWILLDEGKNCPNYIMADFYKNEGQYNMATANLVDALISFSNEVFFATMAYHQEHPRVAMGLFHLGQVFLEQGEHIVALSHFMHTTDIWMKRLDSSIKNFLEELTVKRAVDLRGASGERTGTNITGEQKQDAWTCLQHIAKHTIYDPSVTLTCLQTAKITCATAMSEYLHGNYETAAEMAMKVKVGLHDCKNPEVLDMCQDLYRAANKAMHKKDFKALGVGFKNIAKMKKKSITLEEIIHRHVVVAEERNKEHQLEKDEIERLEALSRKKSKKGRKSTMFGDDGYSLNQPQKGSLNMYGHHKNSQEKFV